MPLLKFGPESYMEQLLNEGLLFFNTVKHFAEVEDEELRGDPDEGLSRRWHHSQITLTLGSPEHPLPTGEQEFELSTATGLTGFVSMRKQEDEDLNVYCMYGMTTQAMWIDPKNFRFGDTAIFFPDEQKLVDRVIKAFRRDAVFRNVRAELVRYVDPDFHSGELAPFCKYMAFEYQCEFRIVLSPGTAKPYKLYVGDLRDIALPLRAKDVNRLPMGYNLLPPKPSL